jgi:hypothetical protein
MCIFLTNQQPRIRVRDKFNTKFDRPIRSFVQRKRFLTRRIDDRITTDREPEIRDRTRVETKPKKMLQKTFR